MAHAEVSAALATVMEHHTRDDPQLTERWPSSAKAVVLEERESG